MFEEATIICEILNNHGFEAYFVGGCIRDKIMGKNPKDIDIATDATPTEVYASMIDRFYVAPTGEKFGTVSIIDFFSHQVLAEVTTYRSEGRYSDKRHPDTVNFEKSLIKDLSRRDLTINAIAYDPIKEEFVDPYHGQRDLNFKTLRAVGNPILRFSEDPLRMMRLFRFASKLGFNIDLATKNAVEVVNYLIKNVSGERVRDELIKMMETDNPKIGIMGMFETELLFFVLPEVDRLYKVPQPNNHHKYDVFNHCLNTMQSISLNQYSINKPYLVLAGLLHDIGKTYPNNKSPYFPNHVDDGVKMLTNIFNRLKLSNENRYYIRFLIKHHMDGYNYINNNSKRGNRRYLSKIKNLELLKDLQILIHADAIGSGINKDDVINKVDLWFDNLYTMIDEKEPFSKKDLVINGNDLLEIGIPASNILGDIQKVLLDEVLNDPNLNNREYLLKRAKDLGKVY